MPNIPEREWAFTELDLEEAHKKKRVTKIVLRNLPDECHMILASLNNLRRNGELPPDREHYFTTIAKPGNSPTTRRILAPASVISSLQSGETNDTLKNVLVSAKLRLPPPSSKRILPKILRVRQFDSYT